MRAVSHSAAKFSSKRLRFSSVAFSWDIGKHICKFLPLLAYMRIANVTRHSSAHTIGRDEFNRRGTASLRLLLCLKENIYFWTHWSNISSFLPNVILMTDNILFDYFVYKTPTVLRKKRNRTYSSRRNEQVILTSIRIWWLFL